MEDLTNKCEKYLKNDRVIAVRPSIIKLTNGNINDAVILSQIFYWFGLNNDQNKDKATINLDNSDDKYIAKSYKDWSEECGIPKSTVRNSIERLKNKGFITVKILYFNKYKKMHFKVNWEKISNWIEENTELPFKRISKSPKTVTPQYEDRFHSNYEWLKLDKGNNHFKYRDDFLEFLKEKLLKPIWTEKFGRNPTIHDAASWISKREIGKIHEIESQYQNFKLLSEGKLPPIDQSDPKLRIYWENKLEELFQDQDFLNYYKDYLKNQPYYVKFLQRKPTNNDAQRSLINLVGKTEGRLKLRSFVEDYYKYKEKKENKLKKKKEKPDFIPEEVALR